MDQVRMLVVEDNPDDQEAFRRMVRREQLPYDYTIAASREEARAVLRDQDFDIVLVDYYLGDGTAFDVIDLIGDKPLIFITGSGDEDTAVRAMKAGASDYLIKDVGHHYLKVLPLTLDRALKHWQAERQVEAMLHERIQRETLAQFIRDASHDLRTSLASLGLAVEIMDRYAGQLMDLASQPAPYETIYSQTTRLRLRSQQIHMYYAHLGRIITGMLEMVRLDNVVALKLEPSDLNAVTSEVIADLFPRAKEKSQHIRFEPSSGALMVPLNKLEFSAVIRHLLDNALLYTPEDGTVVVRTQAESVWATVVVEDNGIGIPAEEIPLIFKRFYRVDKARTTGPETGGSGLGLAIVKRLVEMHYGSIEVESVLGKGSVFRVYLPRPE
jgi:signal transduction histidine kinase